MIELEVLRGTAMAASAAIAFPNEQTSVVANVSVVFLGAHPKARGAR
jgi:hypothetical protein